MERDHHARAVPAEAAIGFVAQVSLRLVRPGHEVETATAERDTLAGPVDRTAGAQMAKRQLHGLDGIGHRQEPDDILFSDIDGP